MQLRERLGRRICALHGTPSSTVCELGYATADAAISALRELPPAELAEALAALPDDSGEVAS